MSKQTPTKDGRELANRQHQPIATELAKTRVFIGARNLFEPIKELQLEDGRQLKWLAQNTAGMLKLETQASIMQTKMTNTDKAIWEDMGKETANKLEDGQFHNLLFAIIAVIEILEGDGILGNRHNAMIGDGNAEDVATEVFKQLFFVVEWFLDIDFPIFGKGFGEHSLNIKSAMIGVELVVCPKFGDFKTETIAEQIGEEEGWEEELVRSRIPGIARRRGDKSSTCNDEVDMQMLLHSLPPSVHDQREADVATEILLTEFLQ